MMTQPANLVQEAWDEAAARPHGPLSAKGLVKDADPTSCVGAMEQLLHRKRAEVILCDHLWASRGCGSWYATLEDPDFLKCAACLPQMYVNLLRKPRGAFRHRCACCGTVKLLSGIRKVSTPTHGGTGTVLGVLCRDCATEETPGLVAATWK